MKRWLLFVIGIFAFLLLLFQYPTIQGILRQALIWGNSNKWMSVLDYEFVPGQIKVNVSNIVIPHGEAITKNPSIWFLNLIYLNDTFYDYSIVKSTQYRWQPNSQSSTFFIPLPTKAGWYNLRVETYSTGLVDTQWVTSSVRIDNPSCNNGVLQLNSAHWAIEEVWNSVIPCNGLSKNQDPYQTMISNGAKFSTLSQKIYIDVPQPNNFQCPSFCRENVLLTNGTFYNGVCQYKEVSCNFGCSHAQCKLFPFDVILKVILSAIPPIIILLVRRKNPK